jgi:hypothetical protein
MVMNGQWTSRSDLRLSLLGGMGVRHGLSAKDGMTKIEAPSG